MNEYIASIADEFHQLGVKHVVLSAGSRCTPLSLWFCKQGEFKVYMQVDERSAAFFALGLAKNTDEPVVLVCTSGSAGAHYWPAITEAWFSRVPLIILTADRPPESQFVGAPQTIDQTKLFGDMVKHFETLVIPEENIAFTYPRTVVRKAYIVANAVPKGPVQINVPIREPLTPELKMEYLEKGRSLHRFNVNYGLKETDYSFDELRGKCGVIVAGPDSSHSHHGENSRQAAFVKLAEALHIPILADPLSNVRRCTSAHIIDAYDAFLADFDIKEELKPEFILMLGQAPVSKRLQQLIGANKSIPCIQVDESTEFRNPGLTTSLFLQADPEQFALRGIESLGEVEITERQKIYMQSWQKYQAKMREKLLSARTEEKMFEGRLVCEVQQLLPQNANLFVSNSMAVRDMDYFWQKGCEGVKVLGNRGTNGIDGTISTALGGAASSDKPTVLLTGDLSFMHDMNGLTLGTHYNIPLVIVLFNNNGGGIFQYLPQKGNEYFEELFSTPQNLDYRGVATLYGIEYHKPQNYEEFKDRFTAALQHGGVTLLDMHTDKELSYNLHKKYVAPKFSHE